MNVLRMSVLKTVLAGLERYMNFVRFNWLLPSLPKVLSNIENCDIHCMAYCVDYLQCMVYTMFMMVFEYKIEASGALHV